MTKLIRDVRTAMAKQGTVDLVVDPSQQLIALLAVALLVLYCVM